MTRRTKAELEALVASLQQENAALKARDVEISSPDAAGSASRGVAAVLPHRRSRGWAVLSAVLIVVGLILAPISVVSSWAKVQLSSTDQFVATFAPLADDPAVQSYVSAQVVAAIEEQVDIPAITGEVFDGLSELGLPPRAAAALQLLKAPAAVGVQNLVTTAVDRLIASDAFSDIWAAALRVSHRQLTATLQGDTNAALSISGSGQLGVQLGPIIDEVKSRLVADGFAFAANLPSVQRTVVIATADAFTTVQLVYGLAIAVGTWMPFVALVLLAAGVLIARRRVGVLIGTSVALGLIMAALAAGFGVGRLFFVSSVSPSLLPSDAAGVIYDQVIELMRSTTAAMTVLAFMIALVAWFSSRYPLAVKLRGFVGSGVTLVRTAAGRRGITTGRFGEWMWRQRVLVRVLIGVVAAAVLLLSRPLHAPIIIWTVVLALVAVLIAELLQRPEEEAGLGVADDAGGSDTDATPAPPLSNAVAAEDDDSGVEASADLVSDTRP